MNRVHAVCFDLDNTLWDVWPAITRAEQALYAWLDQRWPRITARYDVAGMRDLRQRTVEDFPDRRHDLTFLRKEALRRHAREAGYPESLAEEGFELFYAIRNEVEPYPDVIPALDRLRSRFRLLSLSNGNADLARIGLAGYFEHSLGAREAGAAKPDPRIFQALLARAGLSPAEVLYVGDEPVADIEGARAAGLPAIWINRGGHAWPGDVLPPDRTIVDLEELARDLLA
jgi:2-haloalkanoic acid dehalogenase type II